MNTEIQAAKQHQTGSVRGEGEKGGERREGGGRGSNHLSI